MSSKKTEEKDKNDDINNLPLVMGLRSSVSDLQSEITRLKKEVGKQKQFEYELVRNVDKLNPYVAVYKPTRIIKTNSKVSAVIQFSDWHIGEMIDKGETGELNEYNYKIAQKRIFKIVDNVCNWVALNRNSYTIDTLHILDLGDNISGDIHQELTITNEFPVPEQIIMAAYLKAEVFRRLAANFKQIKVSWVAPDNHSRKTRKPQAKQSGKNSENYLVGFLAKTMLSNIKNIDFDIELAHQLKIVINGQRYICEHGNNVKSVMGFPYYGLDRKVGREAKRSMSTNDGFDKLLIGHFHIPFNTAHFNIGPSLSATSEYDHQAGRHASAGQCAWFVHDKNGEFNWCVFRG